MWHTHGPFGTGLRAARSVADAYVRPTSYVRLFDCRAPVAQRIEQWTSNPMVAGSTPAGGALVMYWFGVFLSDNNSC